MLELIKTTATTSVTFLIKIKSPPYIGRGINLLN